MSAVSRIEIDRGLRRATRETRLRLRWPELHRPARGRDGDGLRGYASGRRDGWPRPGPGGGIPVRRRPGGPPPGAVMIGGPGGRRGGPPVPRRVAFGWHAGQPGTAAAAAGTGHHLDSVGPDRDSAASPVTPAVWGPIIEILGRVASRTGGKTLQGVWGASGPRISQGLTVSLGPGAVVRNLAEHLGGLTRAVTGTRFCPRLG